MFLGEALPGIDEHASTWPFVGLALTVVALGLVALGLPAARSASQPIDRCWIDFRDGFGAVWALRVLERVNATATANGWPARLTWRGIARIEGATLTDEAQQAMFANFKSLLRRFVEPQWIDARVDKRM